MGRKEIETERQTDGRTAATFYAYAQKAECEARRSEKRREEQKREHSREGKVNGQRQGQGQDFGAVSRFDQQPTKPNSSHLTASVEKSVPSAQ